VPLLLLVFIVIMFFCLCLLFFCMCPSYCSPAFARYILLLERVAHYITLWPNVRQQPFDFISSLRQRLPAQQETRCLQTARGGGRLKTIYCCTSEQDSRQHAREGGGGGGDFRYMLRLEGGAGGWCRCGGGSFGRSARLREKSVSVSSAAITADTAKNSVK
jgi:hypothetical protein